MHDPSFIKNVLHYEPKTGIFTFKQDRGSNKVKGKIAGHRRKDGYWVIGLQKKLYLGHRVAFAWMTGAWPENQIDHVDGTKTNNCWNNLRAATASQNNCNHKVRRDSVTGLKGVQFHPQTKKWRARLRVDGKNRHLGLFETPHLAQAAYAVAAREVYGAFARIS